MATFQVHISTPRGAKVLTIIADSEREARARAARSGMVLKAERERKSLWRRPLSEADRHTMLTRLAAMLASRIGVGEALRLLRDTFSGTISRTSGELLGHIENSSQDLPDAMGQVGKPDFPDTIVALVKAGSRAGNTAQALNDAITFEQEIRQVQKTAAKGMFGAITGFLAAAGTILGSSFYMGPEVLHSGLIQAGGKDLNVGWIFTVGDWLGYAMVAVLILAVPLALLATLGRQILPDQADHLILKIPFYNEMVLSRGNYITLYGLAMLVKSGVRLEVALRLARDTSPKGALRTDLQRAEEAVRRGQPWAKAMHTLHPTDKAALLSALDKEQVAKTLLALANQYKEIYAQRLGTFVPTLTLISALLLTMAGGILFGETILPMLQASQGITGG